MVEPSSRISNKFVIPAGKGTAFNVKQGQVLKIIALEGDQCLDAVFFNARIIGRPFTRSIPIR